MPASVVMRRRLTRAGESIPRLCRASQFSYVPPSSTAVENCPPPVPFSALIYSLVPQQKSRLPAYSRRTSEPLPDHRSPRGLVSLSIYILCFLIELEVLVVCYFASNRYLVYTKSAAACIGTLLLLGRSSGRDSLTALRQRPYFVAAFSSSRRSATYHS